MPLLRPGLVTVGLFTLVATWNSYFSPLVMLSDVRSPQSAEQAHQQSLAIASSRHEADDQAFIDALSDDE